MIPISLKLKGLYSYQTEQVIDFTTLSQTKLFGIFGAVGSGKSSILEAICLALYGMAERLDTKKPGPYQFVNLKSNELFIEFIFQINSSTEYKFIFQVKRTKRHFHEFSAIERVAYSRTLGGEWVLLRDVKGEDPAKEIIGLGYDHFKKVMIIPQGKFQELLLLTDSERVRIWQELFHLDQFDLYYKTATLERSVEDELTKLNGQLEQLQGAVPEDFIILEEKIAVLEKELTEKGATLQTFQAQHEALKILQQKKQAFDQYTQKQTKFQQQLPQIEALETQLRNYKVCFLHFKALLDQQKTLDLNFEKQSKAFQNLREKRLQKAVQFKTLQERFQVIEKDYQQKDFFGESIHDLRLFLQIYQIQARLHAIQLEVEKKKGLAEELVQHQHIARTYPSLKDCENWYALAARLAEDLTKTKQALKDAESKADSYLKAFQDLLQKLISDPILSTLGPSLSNPDFQALEKILKLHAQKMELELQTSHTKVQELLTKQQLYEYTTLLKEGKPCPLCGSEDHPHILELESVKTEIEIYQSKQVQNRQALARLTAMIATCSELKVHYGNALVQIQQKKVDFQEKEKALSDYRSRFTWPDFDPDNPASFRASLDRVLLSVKQVPVLEKEQAIYANLVQEQTKLQSQKDTLLGQIKRLTYDDYKLKSFTYLEEERGQLEKKLGELESCFQKTKTEQEIFSKEIHILEGTFSADQLALERLTEQKQTLNEKILQLVQEKKYDNLEKVQQILAQELDISAEKERIQLFRKDFDYYQRQIATLSTELAQTDFSQIKYDEFVLTLQNLVKELDSKKELKITLTTQRASLKKNLDAKKILLQKQGNFTSKLNNIRVLINLFKGNGFVKYVARVYLENLCRMANLRFRQLTRQALSLELTEHNEFQVQDHLNNGHFRSIKSLSGGQMFQAAFCLALALSENISALNHYRDNFFFMDEGFGALDQDSLQTVLMTLRALKDKNRIVGIISHVESLKQELDFYLNVNRDEVMGSHISTSW